MSGRRLGFPPGSAVPRRSVLAGAAMLWLAGCASEPATPPAAPSAAPTPTPSGPRTVEHRYGSTEVPADPQRVATVGIIDHDAMLAVGVVPVGLTAGEYSAEQPHGVWPWAQEKLGGATPEILPYTEIDFEKIAALRPDLILAVYAGLTDKEYARLSQIAPTVAQSGEYADYETPWEEMTRTIGLALGRQDAAEQAVAGVEAKLAELKQQHPEFAGKSAAYAGYYEPGSFYIEREGSTRVEILTALGFVAASDLPAGTDFYVDIGDEQLNLLDRDLVVWELGDTESRTVIEADAIYQRLPAHQEGRDVFVTDQTAAGALALVSVLSLPYAVDRLVPQLVAAVDGDPATVVPA